MATDTNGGFVDNEAPNIGTIDVYWVPQVYWIFIGSVITMFTAVKVYEEVLYHQRLRSAQRNDIASAKPKNCLSRSLATLTAILREISLCSLPNFRNGNIIFRQPSLGPVLMVLADVVLVVVLCFYGINASDPNQYQNLGYRAGYVSLGQLPLIVLLSGKRNIIGWLTGSSYERLNWLHRWLSRTLLLTVTLHLAWWLVDWQPYGYFSYQITHDHVTQTGFAAWCILIWLVFSSMTPIRAWSYELFIIQHVISFIGFIAAIMLHLHASSGDYVWVWLTIAVFAFDRVVRALYHVYTNLSFFSKKSEWSGGFSGLLAYRAELTPLAQGMTRITINNPHVSWKPGQHMFLTCHTIIPLQSHPFTIASIPQDGKLEFLVKAHKGGTRRLFRHAEKLSSLPFTRSVTLSATISVAINGPYGRMRPLRQFNSVVLLAGSTGATFTVPLLRDLVLQWQGRSSSTDLPSKLEPPAGAVTRHVRFVWVLKSRSQASWFASQLNDVVEDVRALRKGGHDVQVEISIYVTCDDNFAADCNNSTLSSSEAVARRSNSPPPESKGPKLGKTDSEYDVNERLVHEEDALQQDGQTVHVREVDSRSKFSPSSRSMPSNFHRRKDADVEACHPDGTCCCGTTIKDEAVLDGSQAKHLVCTCNGHNVEDKQMVRDAQDRTQPILSPEIAILSGRPHPRSVVQRSLEQATGETAVVVCGPKGLCDDVRRCCVAPGDGRTVHKGAGAQGVWFHAEGWGY